MATGFACGILGAMNSRSAACITYRFSRSPSALEQQKNALGSGATTLSVPGIHPTLLAQTTRAKIPWHACVDDDKLITTILPSPSSPWWLLRNDRGCSYPLPGWPSLYCPKGRERHEQGTGQRDHSQEYIPNPSSSSCHRHQLAPRCLIETQATPVVVAVAAVVAILRPGSLRWGSGLCVYATGMLVPALGFL